MYLGRVVEALPDTAAPARHPYTRTLMESTFEPDPKKRHLIAPLEGEVPSPFDLPPGCAFAARCVNASAICRSETPPLTAEGGHGVACHHPI
jgi:oligopeptide/dipeptide ABC transporter ATP-binding protein